MSDTYEPDAPSRVDAWRKRLLVFAPIAFVVAILSCVAVFVNALAPYPKCYPGCDRGSGILDVLLPIGAIATPALIVLAVIALIVRWRLPRLADAPIRDRRLSVAILVLLCVLIGTAGFFVVAVPEFVALLGSECSVHGC